MCEVNLLNYIILNSFYYSEHFPNYERFPALLLSARKFISNSEVTVVNFKIFLSFSYHVDDKLTKSHFTIQFSLIISLIPENEFKV